MALAHRDPNTIYISGPMTPLNEWIGTGTITPGFLLEFYDNSGKNSLRAHSSATEQARCIVALEKSLNNKGVDDTYAANELIYAGEFQRGGVFWGIVQSGETISNAEPLQSAGNGKLKSATAATADANVYRFQPMDNLGEVAADTRCRVMVI
jgi:hypothetical protein